MLIGAFILMLAFCNSSLAAQLKFGDWVGIAETDPLTDKENKKIGTFAKDGISALWLSVSDSGEQRIQLALESKKIIASDYFSYRIDNVDTLMISSALKGCESNCLIEYLPQKGGLIQSMKDGLRIKFEYDSYPDITQNPTSDLGP
ncbi:MAG: hypothetical protein P8130_15520 [Deltaproteobacteria bacterium]